MRFAACYARALASVTLERANADLILGELERFAELMRTSGDARAAFTNPAINRTQRARALDAVLARLGLSPETANFLRLLCRNGRLGALDAVINAFRGELDRRRGILTAEITTARHTGEEERRMLVESLERATGKVVRPQWKLDPSIVGGASVNWATGSLTVRFGRSWWRSDGGWPKRRSPPSMLSSRPARRSGEGRKKYDEA
jgi:F-type H+-transporting ATPase subunit delta